MKHYPRVLIISGYTFNSSGGGGITLSNLFRGWPKERLAIVDADASCCDPMICDLRYRLVRPSVELPPKRARPRTSHKLAKFLGVAGGVRPIKFTPALMAFVHDFRPDIIYTQASQLSYMWLVERVQRCTGARLVYHIMDDFPATTYKRGLLAPVVHRIMQRKVRDLVEKSSARLGISSAMCDAYRARYGVEFRAFNNPVDLARWDGCARDNSGRTDEVRIVYAGRIGVASRSSIRTSAEAVRVLRSRGMNATLLVYTNLALGAHTGLFEGLDEVVEVHESPDSVSDLASILCDATLLLLPVDFDKESIEFIRYSLPTKVPTYMMSGTPIVVFGPPEVYSVQHAGRHGWGQVVEQNDPEFLASKIEALMLDAKYRIEMAGRARKYAADNFDAECVRDSFRGILADTLSQPSSVNSRVA